jgi:hypothetical protein
MLLDMGSTAAMMKINLHHFVFVNAHMIGTITFGELVKQHHHIVNVNATSCKQLTQRIKYSFLQSPMKKCRPKTA